MPRPPKPRRIDHCPDVVHFKPQGVPLRQLEEVELGPDEVEAMRLADLEGLPHEEVGKRMEVSRATAGRILASARRKVAEALVNGLAIRIETVADQEVPTDENDRRIDMPGFDKTGPQGEGPQTGRKQGQCTDKDNEGQATPTPGRGQGRGLGAGRGPGRGLGRGLPRGPGRGPGRGGGRGRGNR